MDTKKTHIVANINASDISNSIFCVFEYIDDEYMPNDVFVIADYDEIDETLKTDFSKFDQLKIDESIDNKFDQYKKLIDLFEETYIKGHSAQEVSIPVYQVITYLQEKNGKSLCVEDFENEQLIEYVKDNFNTCFIKEQELRILARNSPLNEIFFENYLNDRKENLGF